MGRPLRHQDADTLYLVSNECSELRCLLRPDAEVVSLVESWLRRALAHHELRIHATMFARNRYWMIVSAPKLNRHDFMRYFQSNLARGVNAHLGRKGSVFPKRYKAVPLLDDEAVESAWVDMMSVPVEERLVSHPEGWTGVNSAAVQLGRRDGQPYLTRLPGFSSDAEQARILGEALDARLERVNEAQASRTARKGSRRRCASRTRQPRRVGCGQHWRWRPHPGPVERTPRCLGEAHRCARYREEMRGVRTAYTEALVAWRRGCVARFPDGTLPPGWLCCANAGSRRGRRRVTAG